MDRLDDVFGNELPDDDAADEDAVPAEPVDLAAERVSRRPRRNQRGDKSQSTQLVELARQRFEVVKDRDGRIYAVDRAHPGIAIALRGTTGVRQQIASVFYDGTGKAASSAALADMLNVIEGDALKAAPTPVFLRVGEQSGVIYLDLGAADGTVVAIDRNGWNVLNRSPVLFRRSALTSELPEPQRASDGLDRLRRMLNVGDSGFRLMVGWLVAALVPDIPHPILALIGQQGTAKTTAMTMLASVIDPSAAPARTPPRDEDSWGTMALHSWVIGLDNISRLAPWFQDALCKICTGDGIVRRTKYSDDEPSVQRFKRPVALTSIDPGALNGDVADRLLSVELEPISRAQRRTEADVRADFEHAAPAILGGLLDLLAQVLDALPRVHLAELPRMADFARILAALDRVTGWQTLPDYLAAADAAAQTVIDSDAFASALKDFVDKRGTWDGTAAQLGALLEMEKPPPGWPRTAQAVGGRLRRIAPAMAQVGIRITERPRTMHGRGWTIESTPAPTTNTRACDVCGDPLSPDLPDDVRHVTCADENGYTTTKGTTRQ